MWGASSDSPGGAFVVEGGRIGAAAALQCNESEHCAGGDIGVLGEGGGGALSDVCESYEKAALLCLLPSTRETYQVC